MRRMRAQRPYSMAEPIGRPAIERVPRSPHRAAPSANPRRRRQPKVHQELPLGVGVVPNRLGRRTVRLAGYYPMDRREWLMQIGQMLSTQYDDIIAAAP